MNIVELLPTKKVTAGLVGAALAIAIIWLLVEVFSVLEEWPETFVMVAWTVLLAFILAWVIPEGVWGKVQDNIDSE